MVVPAPPGGLPYYKIYIGSLLNNDIQTNIYQVEPEVDPESNYSVMIPDANFRYLLTDQHLIQFTDNNDGNYYADSNSLLAIYGLNIVGSQIQYLTGIQAMLSLNTLTINNTSFIDLSISGLNNLTNLYCNNNSNLQTLTLDNLNSLTRLHCNNNKLTSLDVTGLNSLMELYCYDNQLETLYVTGLTILSELKCERNNLTSLNVTGLTSLSKLYCYNNQLSPTLNVTGSTILSELYCQNNNLTSLDVRGLTNLTDFNCRNNNLTPSNTAPIITDLTEDSIPEPFNWSTTPQNPSVYTNEVHTILFK